MQNGLVFCCVAAQSLKIRVGKGEAIWRTAVCHEKTDSDVAVCPLAVCSMALRQTNLCYNRHGIKPTDLLNYFCCCYTSALLVWEHQDFGLEIGEEEQILGALSATQHQKVHHS